MAATGIGRGLRGLSLADGRLAVGLRGVLLTTVVVASGPLVGVLIGSSEERVLSLVSARLMSSSSSGIDSHASAARTLSSIACCISLTISCPRSSHSARF